jgi:hypothetical protein
LATKTKGKQHIYMSEHHDMVITRVKPDERFMPNGRMVVTNGSAYEKGQLRFKDGRLQVREGDQVLPTGPAGEEEDVVQFLDRRAREGAEFFKVDDPAPAVSTDELTTIALLAAAGNREELEKVFAAESEGHGRPEVLEAVRAAVGAIDGKG